VTLGNEPVAGVEESGFSYQEYLNGQPFRWTDGTARLVIPIRAGEAPRALLLRLVSYRTEEVKSATLHVRANQRDVFKGRIPQGQWEKTLDLSGVELGKELVLELLSDTYAPLGRNRGNGQGKSDDPRELGVLVLAIQLLNELPQPSAPANPKVRQAARGENEPGITVWKGHPGGVSCAALTPDGKTMVSGSWDGTIKLWDVEKGKERRTLPVLVPNVTALAISPDGSTFATAAHDGVVRIWEAATGELRVALDAPVGPFSSSALAYSP